MTIHSFCQSVLGRFPIEAGILPTFKALAEDEAAALLNQAKKQVFKKARQQKGSPLSEALAHLASVQNEEQLDNLLANIMSERRQMQEILKKNFGIDGFYTNLCQSLDVSDTKSADKILWEATDSKNFDEKRLRQACPVIAKATQKYNKYALPLQQWLDADQQTRIVTFEFYKDIFLTQKQTKRAAFINTDLQKEYPEENEVLEKEAQRLFELVETYKTLEIVTLTRDLFLVASEIFETYEAIKSQKSTLDYDDLILNTLDLLQGNTAHLDGLDATPWVRYKMDQGIDHILVDEAQDTNPEQWEIIQALTGDFFDGESKEGLDRTLFVVGDEKQSIFSFQRASPEKFDTMRQWFRQKIEASHKELREVDFITSFRSTKSVLKLVDTVFADDMARKGLGKKPIEHEAFYKTQGGQVELWPLFTHDDKEEIDPWTPPIEKSDSTSAASKMAEHIGKTLGNWIGKEKLESYDRTITAGDILILVRTRTAFIDQLVRALKTRKIPVSGVDRMVLGDQLVVQDLCAAAQFGLLPEDDLVLAGLLKSPFIGWNEDQLFETAYDRKGSLWLEVKKSGDEKTILWLSNLIKHASKQNPYEFFDTLLQKPCPANDQSGLKALQQRLGEELRDPLDEFLNSTLDFDQNQAGSLQKFVQQQHNNKNEIKRQMEEAGKAVRIMTVHAAKGLQAPIVILPDTVITSNSLKSDKIAWPNRCNAPHPYFCPNVDAMPEKLEHIRDGMKEKQEEEYQRLLYVAMTRAENRLYVGGYHGKTKPLDNSWYRSIEKAFPKLEKYKEVPFGNDVALTYKNEATGKPEKKDKNTPLADNDNIKLPEWLFASPKGEDKQSSKTLQPYHPSGSGEVILSPLQNDDQYRFMRGNITHKLLQILPDINPTSWQQAAEKYVVQAGQEFSANIQREIVTETLNVLNDPDFAPIFGTGSMAEVSISGHDESGRVVSGQIDRLLITDKEILIIDYKTNRPPPEKKENVPEIYINQMTGYRDIIRKVYPDKAIRTALVWTHGCRLMELDLS